MEPAKEGFATRGIVARRCSSLVGNALSMIHPAFATTCCCHGSEKDNNHKFISLEVERDEETGEDISDRKRNRNDHKRDCATLYQLACRCTVPGSELVLSCRWALEMVLCTVSARGLHSCIQGLFYFFGRSFPFAIVSIISRELRFASPLFHSPIRRPSMVSSH